MLFSSFPRGCGSACIAIAWYGRMALITRRFPSVSAVGPKEERKRKKERKKERKREREGKKEKEREKEKERKRERERVKERKKEKEGRN